MDRKCQPWGSRWGPSMYLLSDVYLPAPEIERETELGKKNALELDKGEWGGPALPFLGPKGHECFLQKRWVLPTWGESQLGAMLGPGRMRACQQRFCVQRTTRKPGPNWGALAGRRKYRADHKSATVGFLQEPPRGYTKESVLKFTMSRELKACLWSYQLS